jgi:4-amino-4-deoxy-L-arabinose transferase-like glycosyltransferase
MNNQNKPSTNRDLPEGTSRVHPLEVPHPFEASSTLDRMFALLVFSAAIFFRLLFFYLNSRNNPAFDFPIMDSLYHHDWAKEIISGNFWGNEIFFRGPLYPYFLALLFKISGSSISFALICQHIIGSFTCVLVYMLASEHYSRRVALSAGLLTALYWPIIFFEGELLIVTTLLFFNTLFILLFIKSIKRDDSRLLLAAGVVLGLAALTRPSVLVFIPAIPIVFFFLRNRTNPRTGIHWLGRSALVILFCLLVILPIMIRNYKVGKAIVPIASSGGVNFYIGNNPEADGRTAIVPGTAAPWWGGNEEAIAIAERAVGKKLTPAQASSYYFRQGFQFITSQPARAVRLFLHKLRMFWTSEERSNDKFIYFFWNLAGMDKVPLPGFWIVTPLALLGILLQWKRRRELSTLFLFILAYMLGVTVFFVNARFRLPVVPLLIVFASFSVHYLIATIRENKKLFALLLLLTAIFTLAVNYDFFTIRKTRSNHLAISHYTLGSALIRKEKKDKAITQYEMAYRHFNQNPTQAYELIAREVNYKLGALYWEKGECQKTIRILKYIRGEDDQSIASMGFLGDCYFKTGQLRGATKVFVEILDIRPDYMPALTGLVQTLATGGDLDTALQVLELAKEHFPPDDSRIQAMVQEIERLKANKE